ncbi:MAG: RAD55 family ATPase [Candidatus Nezhaarchaeales archaeon]
MSAAKALISTGIKTLDNILGGGFPNGSLILVLGDPGSGHRLFVQQLLYAKAKEGGKVAYATVEDTPEEIKSEMQAYGWDVDQVKDLWEFIDIYSQRMNVRRGISGRRVLLDSLSTTVPSMIADGRWSVVDTFSYFLLLYDLRELLDPIDAITHQVRRSGGLHFLIVISGLHEPKTITTIEHFADGVLSFELLQEETEAVGSLRIKKLRRMHHAPRTIPYRITDYGIVVETAVRIA